MKKLIIVLLAAMSMTGMAQNEKYQINGTLAGDEFKGQKVYLYDVVTRKAMDSAMVVKGKFVMKGESAQPKMGRLQVKGTDGSQCYLDVVVEAGTIVADPKRDVLKGTKLNDRLSQFQMRLSAENFGSQLDRYYKEYAEAKDQKAKDEAERKYDSVDAVKGKVESQLSEELYYENKENILGCYAMQVMLSADNMTPQRARELSDGAPRSVVTYKPVKDILERMSHLEKTAVGKMFTDIEGVDFETGEMTKLSTMINGKVALVDFWASWCSPCRQEIKNNLKRIYETYRDKNFVLVGVDVWDKPDAHRKAVEQMSIEYPQLIDESMESTTNYGVNGIPHIMLIDENGVIVARDLRGEAIEKAVSKALGM